jgi:hypothetical protein
VRVLVDDAGKHGLYPPQRILKYGYRVLCFDYGSDWRQSTEGRGNGEDGGDMGLCNGAD